MNKGVQSAFTLIELIAVVIIISVLATIVVPNYNVMRERSLNQEAIANLKLIAASEKIWRMESNNNVYRACECQCQGTGSNCCNNVPDGCNYQLRLSLNSQNWHYWVGNVAAAGNPPTFTAYADRVGSGGYLDCQYDFSQTDNEPNPNVHCPR